MNNTSASKKIRKPVSNNVKAKISKSVKNAYNRNKAAASSVGLNLKTYRAMKKTGIKKNVIKKNITNYNAPNYNPFNAALNALPAPIPGTSNPFNIFNNVSTTMSIKSANTKKLKNNKSNVIAKTKMSSAQKSSSASAKWHANVKKIKNNMGVSQKEAMVIASEKRKEKAKIAKLKNNVNLIKFSNLSISNKQIPSTNFKKNNINVMSSLGM
jgi:hypothetical protein